MRRFAISALMALLLPAGSHAQEVLSEQVPPPFPVPAGESAALRCEPQVAVVIFRDLPDIVAAECTAVVGVANIGAHRVAVVAIQAFFRRKPDEPVGILQDGHDRVLRKPVLQCHRFEVHRLWHRLNRCAADQACEREDAGSQGGSHGCDLAG